MKFQKLFSEELNEIKEHKIRVGLLSLSLFISIIFLITNLEEEVNAIESPKQIEKPVEEKRTTVKNETKSIKIAGLEKSIKDVELQNPFKSDLIKEVKEEEKQQSQIQEKVISQPRIEDKTQTILILKGTAISGDKKMAIIKCGILKSNSEDKNQIDTLTVKVGDEVAGRKIIDIDKKFVAFDNGERLYLNNEN